MKSIIFVFTFFLIVISPEITIDSISLSYLELGLNPKNEEKRILATSCDTCKDSCDGTSYYGSDERLSCYSSCNTLLGCKITFLSLTALLLIIFLGGVLPFLIIVIVIIACCCYYFCCKNYRKVEQVSSPTLIYTTPSVPYTYNRSNLNATIDNLNNSKLPGYSNVPI